MKRFGAAAVTAVFLVGCASVNGTSLAGGDPSASSSIQRPVFWQAHGAGVGREVDRPTSLKELGGKVGVVALGRITGYAEGRDYTDPGRPPNKTGNVEIAVQKSSSDVRLPGTMRVEFTRHPLMTADEAKKALPEGEFIFFLTDWYSDEKGAVYRCTSPSLCVLGVDDGQLISLREPDAAIDLATERSNRRYPAVEDIYSEATSG
ncbi:MAG: hypothetical protein QM695_09705 [Micropruina sp.]